MIVGGAAITILKDFVVFPAIFVALTEKFNVPAAVGVPDITPVAVFNTKPVGSLPLLIDHVIGTVPVALRV